MATSCEELTHWKRPDAERDWEQEEKGTTEDEMAGWHHVLNAQEFGWTPGVGDGQGGLVCCGPWGRKESDMTERLNLTGLSVFYFLICSKLRERKVVIYYPHSNCNRRNRGFKKRDRDRIIISK